jgi:putative transposase
MPRIARIVGAGYPHHIVQRGNNREKVFFDQDDYEKYLSFLARYSEKRNASILAYCLMPNHIHLLIRPSDESAPAKMMQGVTLCYTQYFNRKNNRTGRLWECRYHSTIVDEERYLWAVCKYIENNPVRAGLVGKPEDYPYSSGKAHLLGKSNPVLTEELFDERDSKEYQRLMKLKDDKRTLDDIRKHTRLGRPLGEGEFLHILSRKFAYNVVCRPKGRPRKVSK